MPEGCDRQGASNDLAHQRAFLALVAQLDGGLLLHVAHPLLNLQSKERALVGEVISTVALADQISREFNDDAHEVTGAKLYL